MDKEATRALVKRFLDCRLRNDYAEMCNLLAEDVVWCPPPSVPIPEMSGRDAVAKALTGGGAKTVGGDWSIVEREIGDFIVEGEKAAVVQRVRANAANGNVYENTYIWVYTCNAGQIARMVEMGDTLHAARVFGWITEASGC